MKKLLISLLLSLPFFSFALQKSVSLGKDSRVRYAIYDENQVYNLSLKPGIGTNIVLGKNEKFVSWFSGFESALSVTTKANNNIGIKAKLDAPINTNLTIITNKRTYYFQVTNQQKLTLYSIKFVYPDDEARKKELERKEREELAKVDPTLAPVEYSHYLGIGDRELKPSFIFSSKTHTFIKLKEGARVPAVFKKIGLDGEEQLVNSIVKDDWIIIYDSSDRYTLRLGDRVLCLERIDGFDAEKFKNNIGEK